MRMLGLGIVLLFLFSSCESNQESSKNNQEHLKDVEKWKQQRIERLTKSDGWLTLAGLFWLKEGENSFGAAKDNQVVFPNELGVDYLGSITVDEKDVSISINPGYKVWNDTNLVEKMEIKSDADGKATILSYERYSWFIIKRGDRFAIRLKDKESEILKNFEGIEYWDVDDEWQVEAKYKAHNPPKKIIIPNIMGSADTSTCYGSLHFKIGGEEFTLDPIGNKDAKSLFIVFADETSGMESYGGGRFLYVDGPDEKNKVVIDFNKAYNPPCAFTAFATCPLPPDQNHLPIMITAGEKTYGDGHH